ncbi:hypothetical protein [Neolewinella persica]|uniref:hypothetical protein n=1 Tax=Neolewinella persica TaxID=70998 RepID=UPI00036BE5AE|nr:hypothetical protein [Neolewinella persica]
MFRFVSILIDDSGSRLGAQDDTLFEINDLSEYRETLSLIEKSKVWVNLHWIRSSEYRHPVTGGTISLPEDDAKNYEDWIVHVRELLTSIGLIQQSFINENISSDAHTVLYLYTKKKPTQKDIRHAILEAGVPSADYIRFHGIEINKDGVNSYASLIEDIESYLSSLIQETLTEKTNRFDELSLHKISSKIGYSEHPDDTYLDEPDNIEETQVKNENSILGSIISSVGASEIQFKNEKHPIEWEPKDKRGKKRQEPGLANFTSPDSLKENTTLSILTPRKFSKGVSSLIELTFYRKRFKELYLKSIEEKVNTTTNFSFSAQITWGSKVLVQISGTNIKVDKAKGAYLLLDKDLLTTKFLLTPEASAKEGMQRINITVSIADGNKDVEAFSESIEIEVVDLFMGVVSRPILNKGISFVTGAVGVLTFILTQLGSIDKSLGLTAGTASIGLAGLLGITSFLNYKKLTPTPIG